jgi:hypothetical protein
MYNTGSLYRRKPSALDRGKACSPPVLFALGGTGPRLWGVATKKVSTTNKDVSHTNREVSSMATKKVSLRPAPSERFGSTTVYVLRPSPGRGPRGG